MQQNRQSILEQKQRLKACKKSIKKWDSFFTEYLPTLSNIAATTTAVIATVLDVDDCRINKPLIASISLSLLSMALKGFRDTRRTWLLSKFHLGFFKSYLDHIYLGTYLIILFYEIVHPIVLNSIALSFAHSNHGDEALCKASKICAILAPALHDSLSVLQNKLSSAITIDRAEKRIEQGLLANP